ncbi:PREDICTED: uncharacterized protein LOC103780590 [Merops nubicus]|uniref:uncharacterized protein LOC103780590 n=1 Tax=Merops nubicus TaxID=57421 RepID=UPI0004F08CD8|nr:PREDICTED: uncharacterized protein LOC103780590 [Merops nubicus]
MNLLTQVSSSRQEVAGVVSTAAFFLCEGLLRQHFDVVPNGTIDPQPGDLFLFPLASGGPGWWGAHAGIYCGDGEIIHLEGLSSLGIVAKHGKSHLLRTRGPAKVLRKKGELDEAALQQRIRVAMDQVVEYDAITCNCIHFALTLLGLGQRAAAMVLLSMKAQMVSSRRQYETFWFLLNKSVPGQGEMFKEVSEKMIQPGDIVLFPMDSILGRVSNVFKHAAVYCGDGEVIHFQYTGASLNDGVISKEGFKAMKRKRGKCEIYLKVGKLNLEEFRRRVIAQKQDSSNLFVSIPRVNLPSPCWRFRLLSSVTGSIPGTSLPPTLMPGTSFSLQRDIKELTFVLHQRISTGVDVFEEVSESTLQPGDMVLFPLGNIDGNVKSTFKHVAVYCGDGEVIHFQNRNSGTSIGVISKEGFEAMKNSRGKCQIYRKKGEIVLDDLERKVKEAMNSEGKYHEGINNNIHFAFHLLDLTDFYKTLVEIPGEASSQEAWSLPSVSPPQQGSQDAMRAMGSPKRIGVPKDGRCLQEGCDPQDSWSPQIKLVSTELGCGSCIHSQP